LQRCRSFYYVNMVTLLVTIGRKLMQIANKYKTN